MVYAGPDLLGHRARQRGDARVSRLPADGAGGARHVRGPEDGAVDCDPFPEGDLGQARLRDHLLLQRLGRRTARRAWRRCAKRLPPPIFNWMGDDAVPGDAERCSTAFFPKGLQWYWKGDFVKDAAGRGDRRAHRASGEVAERAVADAPLSDRRRRPSRRDATRPPGARAMRRGRWSSRGSIRIREGRRAEDVGRATTGKPCIRSTSAARTSTS